MTIPTRHGGAPYEGGEILEANDLEADIANVFAVINALADDNFAPDAKIDGLKILNASIDNEKIEDGSVVGDRFKDDVVTNAKLGLGCVDGYAMSGAAVFSSAQTVSEASIQLNTSYQGSPIITQGITTGPSGSSVLVMWHGTLSQLETQSTFDFTVKFTRDVTDIWESVDFNRFNALDAGAEYAAGTFDATFLYVDTGHTANLGHTYGFNAKHSGGGDILRQQLTVVELRR